MFEKLVASTMTPGHTSREYGLQKKPREDRKVKALVDATCV